MGGRSGKTRSTGPALLLCGRRIVGAVATIGLRELSTRRPMIRFRFDYIRFIPRDAPTADHAYSLRIPGEPDWRFRGVIVEAKCPRVGPEELTIVPTTHLSGPEREAR